MHAVTKKAGRGEGRDRRRMRGIYGAPDFNGHERSKPLKSFLPLSLSPVMAATCKTLPTARTTAS